MAPAAARETMALTLPNPTPPQAGNTAHERARRNWLAGQSLAERGDWSNAAEKFDLAFRSHADHAYGLAAAHALICAGQPKAAVSRAAALRKQHPSLALAYTIESHALLELSRPSDAADCLLALPAGAHRDLAHWHSLGMSLQRSQRHDEAIGAFMQALTLKMDDAVVHFYLGMSFKDKGMKSEAAECVRTALLLGLGASELSARAQLVFLEREACRWAAADDEMHKLLAALRAAPGDCAIETGPFVHAVLGNDARDLLKAARLYALRVASFVTPLPRRGARAHSGRLRIAYLSADFHQHATSQLMAQMLESHDRSRFEVTLISAGPDDTSAMRQRIVASSEHFEDLRQFKPAAIAQRIRELNIDILIDAKGATYGTLMPVTAHRAAPLQVSWLGFPGTSGASYVDYFIGDRVVSPLALAGHYSEKIAQLPHCYQPNDSQRLRPLASDRAEWDAPADKLLLCAFHQSYKISPEVFDHWCSILERVPNAVLWLLRWNTNVQDTLLAEARSRGVAAERLLFAPLLPHDEHMRRLGCADIYLDAWPCNAHTTAGEALWVGVPVVTLEGGNFVSRMGASFMAAAGLGDWVADSDAAYVEVAVRQGADRAGLLALKRGMRARLLAAPAWDIDRYTRDLQAALRQIWQDFCTSAGG
jgi:predicted O-linked N-acetylglucosamine transferase (SPINDLY family)